MPTEFRADAVVLLVDGTRCVTDPEEAARRPELAVLSVMAHGGGDVDRAVQVALAAVAGVELISDRDVFVLYSDLIDAALSDAARKAFQTLPQGYEFQNELIRKSLEKGRSEGRAAEKAADVIAFLEARDLAVSDAQRQRITETTDLETLSRWVRRAGVPPRSLPPTPCSSRHPRRGSHPPRPAWEGSLASGCCQTHSTSPMRPSATLRYLPLLSTELGPGPAGQVQRISEEVRKLPRRQQQKVIDVVAAIVNEFKRKAS